MTDMDYVDGIDQQSLRYEKTQNRDLMRTIERINRANKFRDSARIFIDTIKDVIIKDAPTIVNNYWRNKNSLHINPPNLNINGNIVSPIFKKVHAEGDADVSFKIGKEYPFYYIVDVNLEMTVTPHNCTEFSESDATTYSKWYIGNIARDVNEELLKKITNALNEKFSNTFNFSNENKSELYRINIGTSSSLKSDKSSSNGVNVKFSTEEMYDMLVTNMSMALERVIRL